MAGETTDNEAEVNALLGRQCSNSIRASPSKVRIQDLRTRLLAAKRIWYRSAPMFRRLMFGQVAILMAANDADYRERRS